MRHEKIPFRWKGMSDTRLAFITIAQERWDIQRIIA